MERFRRPLPSCVMTLSINRIKRLVFIASWLLFASTAFALPPAVDLDPGNLSGLRPDFRSDFIEDGPAAAISAANATVTDPDSAELAEVRIAIQEPQSGDTLAATTGNTAVSASFTDGELLLSGPAAVADFQTVLRSVTFANTLQSFEPDFRTVTVVADDGAEPSQLRTATIVMTAVNDLPVLDLDPSAEGRDYVTGFAGESGVVAAASPDAALSDLDDDRLTGMVFEISRPQSGDLLEADITGTAISASYEDGVLTLTGEDTPQNYQAVLRTVTFRYTTPTPDRLIAVAASDDRRSSLTAVAIITQTPETPPRAVTTTYIEGDEPAEIVGQGGTLTGEDVSRIDARIINGTPADILSADTSGTALVASYEDGLLTVTGVGGTADYEAVFRSIVYENTSQNPDPMHRFIELRAFSGELASALATTVLAVVPVNDPPRNNLPGPLVTPRDVPLEISARRNNAIVITDPDAGDDPVETRLTVTRGTLATLAVGGAEIAGNDSADMTVTGILDAVNGSLDGLFYNPPPGFDGTVTLTVETDDLGHNGTPEPKQDADTLAITVAVTALGPVADAGADRTVTEGTVVRLDGSNSTGRSNPIVGYEWRRISGPAVSLSDAGAVSPEFVAPDVFAAGATIVFELRVTDAGGAANTDTVAITVADAGGSLPPVANAGADRTVAENSFVQLDGTGSSAPSGEIAAFAWTQEAGPEVALTDGNTARPRFTAPAVGPGGVVTLRFDLTVTDESGLQDNDAVTVWVTDVDEPPSETFEEGETVILNAEPPDAAAYQWLQVTGPAVPVSDPSARTIQFVAPAVGPEGATLTFLLIVTSADGISSESQFRFAVADNGITGYPEGVLPFRPTTSTTMGVRVIGGGLVRLVGVDPATLPEGEDRPTDLIYGMIEMVILPDINGGTVNVDLFLESPADGDMSWFKYSADVGWRDFGGNAFFSGDRRRVTLTLTDGGEGDADGAVNGVITDPSGLGRAADTPPPSGNGAGEEGGCFVESALKKE